MATAPALGSDIVVRAEGLTRTFGEFVAVDHVSFAVTRGEIFGFLGSNGAGKTTTIRILCGLLAPSMGKATVAGFDVATESQKIKTSIGYMSQKFSLYSDLTVDENLRFWAGAYRLWGPRFQERRSWAIAAAGLEERHTSLVRNLPGGYRQRLALGCALLHEPPVVFLDEPTGGVDPDARRRFWDLIDELADKGTTVFVTTHYMDEAERCHRVALMHAGKLLALDTVPKLKSVFPKGTLIELSCPRPAESLAILEEIPDVVEASLFGDRVHVVCARPGMEEPIESSLIESGFPSTEINAVHPSLEDVFIRVIRDAEAGEQS